MVAKCNARAEIMGKMDPTFSSDELKAQIVDFRRRKENNEVEIYDLSELKKELGGEELHSNKGVAKNLVSSKYENSGKGARRSYFWQVIYER